MDQRNPISAVNAIPALDARGPQTACALTDGERWTADALSALRSAHFSPSATGRFLTESFARAGASRARHRRLAHQARLWSLAGASAALAIRELLSTRRGHAPARVTVMSWCALQAAMLDWHLGMVEGLDGELRPRLSAADALTLGRGALAPFAAAAPPDALCFLVLLALAAASDLLDGRLARRTGSTRFGRDFDTLADLAFRAAAVRGAARAGWLPAAARRALLGRQVLLASGAAWHWFARSQRPPADTARLARWDAPPLLAGLALAAAGRRRAGGGLVVLSAGIGTVGLAWPRCAHGRGDLRAIGEWHVIPTG